jgi:hypothetical protein
MLMQQTGIVIYPNYFFKYRFKGHHIPSETYFFRTKNIVMS